MPIRACIVRAFSVLVCLLILFSTCRPGVRAQAPLPASGSSPDSYLPGDPDAPGLFQRDRSISEWYSLSGGFRIADLDGDGANEILAAGRNGWKIFSYDPKLVRYTVEYLSKFYSYETYSGIDCITMADFGPGAGYRILVGAYSNQLEVYDGATHHLVSTAALPMPFSQQCSAMVVSDIDLDGALEIVMFVGSGLRVFNALTFALEWSGNGYPWNDYGAQLVVGNTDADPNPEIVIEDRIIDGVTHAVEWQPASSFGGAIRTADIDADGRDELIAISNTYNLVAYDADTQTTKWTISSPHAGYDTLTVADIDADGTKEIVTGNDQFGDIRTYDSVTRTLEWSIHTPDSGTNSIVTGDTDGDGQVEVLWGTNADSTADDNLWIADAVSQRIEWRTGAGGLYSASGDYSSVATGDVDADGQEEIVVGGSYGEDGINGYPIIVFDAKTLQPEWAGPYSNGGPKSFPIHLANTDADPALEIFFSIPDYLSPDRDLNHGGDLIAIDGKTHVQEWIWKTQMYTDTDPYATITSGDVDLDGQIEVLAGEDEYLSVFDPAADVQEWKSGELYTKSSSYTSFPTEITLCNLDNDANPEMVARSLGLWVFDGKTRAVQWQADSLWASVVTCGDMDGDGQVEVVAGDPYGQVNILNGQTGAIKSSHTLFPQDSFGRSTFIGLRLADLNHDAKLDILCSDGWAVSAFNGTDYSKLWQSQPLADNYRSAIGDLLLEDLDADGRPELLVGSDRSVTLFHYDPSDSNVPSFSSALTATPAVVKPSAVISFQTSFKNTSSAARAFQAVIPLAGGSLDGTPTATLGSVTAQNQSLVWTLTLNPSAAAQFNFSLRLPPDVTGSKNVTLTAHFHGDGVLLDQNRSANVYVDTAPPHSAISSPKLASILPAGDVPVSGTAGDDYSLARVEVQFDNGAWVTTTGTSTWTATLAQPAEGLHQVRTRATDLVGNTETPRADQPLTFTVDATPPQSVITSPAPASLFSKGSVTVQGAASDANGVAKVEVQVDNGRWVSATGTSAWTATLALSGDGPHQIRSRATDVPGNVETPGPAQTVSIYIDMNPPRSTISAPAPASVLPGGQVTVQGTASDAYGVAKVEVQIDSSQWVAASGTSAWTAILTPSGDGTHYLRTRATDLAGKVETPGQMVSFSVDSVAPRSAINSPDPFGVLSDGSGSIRGTASDNHGLAMVEVQIDGGEWASATGTSTWVATPPLPADGLHLVRTRATDLAGNVETPGEGRSVYVSARAPVILSVEPESGSLAVDRNVPVVVWFNVPVSPTTLTLTCDPPVTFGVPRQGASALAVVLDHTPFLDGTVITCTVASAQSTTTHALSAPFIWSFTTSASSTNKLHLPVIFP